MKYHATQNFEFVFVYLCADSSDYTALATTVTIPSGMTSKTFTISTTEDSIAESAETFTVQLSSPSPVLMLGNDATVEISADVVTIGFTQTSFTVSEGGTVTLTVELTGDVPPGQTTVDVMSMNGTATGL